MNFCVKLKALPLHVSQCSLEIAKIVYHEVAGVVHQNLETSSGRIVYWSAGLTSESSWTTASSCKHEQSKHKNRLSFGLCAFLLNWEYYNSIGMNHFVRGVLRAQSVRSAQRHQTLFFFPTASRPVLCPPESCCPLWTEASFAMYKAETHCSWPFTHPLVHAAVPPLLRLQNAVGQIHRYLS
jgi:hypothetical protein